MHRNIFAFFWGFLRQQKRYMFIPLLFAFGLAVQESLGPYLIKIIIDGLPAASNNGNWKPIYISGVFYIISIECINILFRARDYFKLKVFPVIKGKMIEYMYKEIVHKKFEFHLENYSGQLANKIADMIKGVETIFNMLVDVFLWRTLSLLIASFTLYLAHPILAYFLFVWAGLFILGTLKFAKQTHRLATIFSASRNELFGKITDGFSNILNIILYHNQKSEIKRVHNYVLAHTPKEQALLNKSFRVGIYQGLMVTAFTAFLTMALIFYCKAGLLSIGQFSLVIILSGTVIRNVYSISSDLVQFSKELGTCTQALKILNADKYNNISHNNKLDVSKGKIEFKCLSYSYNIGCNIFENLNLTIHPGEKVGIVGISGGGKTTLVNLLLRLFDPSAGKIFIDSQDIQSVSIESLRKNIAVVPQEPVLFNRTIEENIQFGEENIKEEHIVSAAKKAYCHEFITKLPLGYQTVVGERGIKLSGGQKQRIALARAFLKNAPIIIFDEPTSALDSLTEAYIQYSLHKIMHTKTAIVIAHRLSTLKGLDRILVFDQGKIIEQGCHDVLINNKSLYSELWQEQAILHE